MLEAWRGYLAKRRGGELRELKVLGKPFRVLGMPGELEAEFEERADKLSISKAPTVEDIERGLIVAPVRQPGGKHFGGVFDSEDVFVESSKTVRFPGPEVWAGPVRGYRPGSVRLVDQEVVYGGFAFDKFGHFLLESLSRLCIPELLDSDLPIYVQAPENRLTGWAARIYELAGISQRLHVVQESTRFRRVRVPSAALVIKRRAHASYRALGLRVAERVMTGAAQAPTDQPLYLSRSRLPEGRRTYVGESVLEEILRRNGVRVVHPETLDIAEQVRLVNTHRVILGPIGTAFHLTVFSRIQNDLYYLTGDMPSSTYPLCDVLHGNSATYVHATSVVQPVVHPALKIVSLLPTLVDVPLTLKRLHGLGLIKDTTFDPALLDGLEREYRRRFVSPALLMARRFRVPELLEELDAMVQREFPDRPELAEEVGTARRALARAARNASKRTEELDLEEA